jgi:hypothetical protein
MSETILEPVLVSGPTARKLLDIGNTRYWDWVKRGILETVEVGESKMVVYASLKKLATPAK